MYHNFWCKAPIGSKFGRVFVIRMKNSQTKFQQNRSLTSKVMVHTSLCDRITSHGGDPFFVHDCTTPMWEMIDPGADFQRTLNMISVSSNVQILMRFCFLDGIHGVPPRNKKPHQSLNPGTWRNHVQNLMEIFTRVYHFPHRCKGTQSCCLKA